MIDSQVCLHLDAYFVKSPCLSRLEREEENLLWKHSFEEQIDVVWEDKSVRNSTIQLKISDADRSRDVPETEWEYTGQRN